jgi:hypothetical protein
MEGVLIRIAGDISSDDYASQHSDVIPSDTSVPSPRGEVWCIRSSCVRELRPSHRRSSFVASTFFQSLKKQWRQFVRTPAGHRFQKMHEHRQEARSTEHPGRSTWLIVLGTLIAIGGVALLPLPGPGTIVLAAGLILVARESGAAARMLDFTDKRIHLFIQYLRRKWGQWSTTKRVVCAGTAGALLAGAAAGAWLVLAR